MTRAEIVAGLRDLARMQSRLAATSIDRVARRGYEADFSLLTAAADMLEKEGGND